MELWTVGYGGWPAAVRADRLLKALRERGVTRLIDVRHSPCASTPEPGRPYGPRPWNLQTGGAGIVDILADAGIAYEWAVELGNPQRRDPAMTVLRAHLADPEGDWPVHRGLDRLAATIRRPGEVVALLCACDDARTCHRTLIARTLAVRAFAGALIVREVRTGLSVPFEDTARDQSQ